MANDGKGGRSSTRFGGRGLATRVKTAKGRKISSKRWLQRQLNDPFVAEARRQGYRSRAAFKLLQLDDRFQILKPGARVVDLGAAPGGWTQVAIARTGADKGEGEGGGDVIAIDILEMESLAGARFLKLDFTAEGAEEKVLALIDGPVDAVISDMAASATGHRPTDHLRIIALCELAFDFACKVLAPGGAFIAKVLKGGTEDQLLKLLKQDFREVRHAKPEASRADSAETYVVALGFRGKPGASASDRQDDNDSGNDDAGRDEESGA
ncbi:RlmE family RNA methyltransferase [Oceanibacterium hippocampi]|uniref:Ribosomal RNA large subunit methyltransferase E n=1 Tax=Oceanibacterium hippocampi TaxID=745714 RepID=A0A1Y5SSK6_9PROT|nr:RlmE family RNA methyltransferase [Oceanibacterium hippocampi]SLN46810.1 Ribosomal RNA large subunit methyltransferase E [Oceanibacterium hippocampi]